LSIRGAGGGGRREKHGGVKGQSGHPQEFLTGFGLTQPGTEASFKVYVILTTGNEAGSAPMTVERPV
jgi:hypothetical protein